MAKSKKKADYELMMVAFEDLTRNQKLAVINFLSVIAASNEKSKISKIQRSFISQYYKEFGITGDQFLTYISIDGRKRTIADLKSLTKSNFQDLVFTTTELCVCDGELSEDEFSALMKWLDDLGMSADEWNDYLENPQIY